MTGRASVLASRDGDQFHYHWAARRCLELLPGGSDLVAVTIEGPSASEGATIEVGEEIIDVGFYFRRRGPHHRAAGRLHGPPAGRGDGTRADDADPLSADEPRVGGPIPAGRCSACSTSSSSTRPRRSPPWDAVGAIARGRQVIVAGDPRADASHELLRPRSADAEDLEADIEEDQESILDECLGRRRCRSGS